MRIERLQLHDVMRFRDLEVELAPGLTIVRGPNESGKTTLARAIELGLATSVVDPVVAAHIDDLRSWDAEPAARPTVRLDFVADPEGDDGSPIRGRSRRPSPPPPGPPRSPSDGRHPDRVGRRRPPPRRADRSADAGLLPLDRVHRPRRARGPRPRRGDARRAARRVDQRRGPDHGRGDRRDPGGPGRPGRSRRPVARSPAVGGGGRRPLAGRASTRARPPSPGCVVDREALGRAEVAAEASRDRPRGEPDPARPGPQPPSSSASSRPRQPSGSLGTTRPSSSGSR